MFLKVFSVNIRGSIARCNILNASSGNGCYASSSRLVQIISNTHHCPVLGYSTKKTGSSRKHVDKPAKLDQTEELSPDEILMLKRDSDSFGTLSTFDGSIHLEETLQTKTLQTNNENETKNKPHLTNEFIYSKQLSAEQFEAQLKNLMKENSVQAAIEVFEKQLQMKDRILVPGRIFEWLIDECLRFNEFQKAFYFFEQMVNRGLKVSLKTIEKIAEALEITGATLRKVNNLKKLLSKCKDEPTAKLYNILVRIYVRSVQYPTGFELVDEMEQRGFKYETETITAIFDGCSLDKNNGFYRLVDTWHDMQRLGIKPNTLTINAFLRAVYKLDLNDVEKLKEHLDVIKTKWDRKMSEDVQLTNEEIKMNKNIDSTHEIDDGRPNLLNIPPKIGHLFPLENVKAPEHRLLILGGFTRLLKYMKSAKIAPNHETFELLLNVAPNTFEVHQQIIALTQKNNVVPDVNLYNALLMKTCLRKDFQNAQEIIQMMYAAEFEVDLASFGLLAISCNNQKEAEEFFNEVTDSKLNIDIFIAMLKNACAAHDNNFVIEILRKMQTLTKIELNDEVVKMVDDYQKQSFQNFRNQRKPNVQLRNECFKLTRECKQWLRHFGMDKSDKSDNTTKKSNKKTRVSNTRKKRNLSK